MSAPLERFAALVSEATGNSLPPERAETLGEIAARRAAASGCADVAAYVEALAAGRLPDEWRALVALVTIKESYLFRAPRQFAALGDQGLAALQRARRASRELRVWSAACARGEEPATVAMVFAESAAMAGWDWSILATDLDEEALAAARGGLYGERAVALVPAPLRDRWLARCGALFELAPELSRRIEYRPLNLARPPYDPPPGEFDLVLLRNLLIYFPRPLQQRVVAAVASHLRAGGLLLLGASETLWPIQEAMEPVELGGAFFYRHRRPVPVAQPRPAAGGTPAAAPQVGVRRAAPPSAPEPPPPETAAASLLGAASRALAAARLEEARAALERALAVDPGEPAVHALAGRVAERAGRGGEAAAAYRAALYLEPALFQVRVWLAECLLRLGEPRRGAQQAREALALIEEGRDRALALPELPLPGREEARARCRALLAAGRLD